MSDETTVAVDRLWDLIDQARLRPGERFMDANKPEVRQAWADEFGVPYREDTRSRPVGIFYAPFIRHTEEVSLPEIRRQATGRERSNCRHPEEKRRRLNRPVGGCRAVCLGCGGYLRW